MSFGQDPRWRRALVRAIAPAADERILDVATGTGLVARALVKASGCTVVGLDQSSEMLARARELAGRTPGLADRITFVEASAERLPFENAHFDAVTFTYLLRYVDDPGATLAELARVLKPGGRMASLEFGVPEAAWARLLWRGYTRAGLPLIGRAVSPAWYEVGRFLGPSIEELYARYPLERQVALWERANLQVHRLRRMSFGAGVVISAVRVGGPDRA
jgi:demethylmenaquinone methyltransferase/2-methoxy-6-polyprenyl-1,4-benzoquinol methylase